MLASYAARTRAQNAPSACTRKPVCASSAAVRRAAVCAASVRAARANPGEWFCAPSGEGIAVRKVGCELLCISGGLKFAYRILGVVRGVLDGEGLYYFVFCWIEGVF